MGRGELAALGGAIFWAVTNLILRGPILTVGGATAQTWRTAVSTVVFLVAFLSLRHPLDLLAIPTATVGVLLLSVLLSMVLGDILQFTAIRYLGVARTLPIASSYPLLTLLLATATLGEPLTAHLIAGALLVIAGVTLVALPRRSLGEEQGWQLRHMDAQRTGVAFALGSAVCAAAATTLTRVALRGDLNILDANMLRLPFSALLCTGISISQRRQPPWCVERQYVLPLCLAGLTGLASGLCYLSAVQLAGAATTATLNATSPVFGLLGAVMFLRERPSLRSIVGTIVAFLGIVLVI